MDRYDVDTKYGPIGIGVEIVLVDRVDDYETIDFEVTIVLPYGFEESDTRISRKGNKTMIEMETYREITRGRE